MSLTIWLTIIIIFIVVWGFIIFEMYNAPTVLDDLPDKDVFDFLNDPANNKEPHEMGDTHEYIKGGLTMPKENTNKLNKRNLN